MCNQAINQVAFNNQGLIIIDVSLVDLSVVRESEQHKA